MSQDLHTLYVDLEVKDYSASMTFISKYSPRAGIHLTAPVYDWNMHKTFPQTEMDGALSQNCRCELWLSTINIRIGILCKVLHGPFLSYCSN